MQKLVKKMQPLEILKDALALEKSSQTKGLERKLSPPRFEIFIIVSPVKGETRRKFQYLEVMGIIPLANEVVHQFSNLIIKGCWELVNRVQSPKSRIIPLQLCNLPDLSFKTDHGVTMKIHNFSYHLIFFIFP